ncbi:type IV toxin-antitoxin system AbiEi family antitoxin domain-containing protein [Nocardioides sp. WS12]|uniref:type IV toxin-antitoxin system AbiEi family antitoxin domain-containing protein n=1 Tax=Nocardioides sp. WS12 TaxID=2486272 RepID=UPI00191EB881|nr:type IV toxin-antitoxin system AbiEi family antitoxin domain-containing protein [Nocardioides sp. WS12]
MGAGPAGDLIGMDNIDGLLDRQDGVISRRQALTCGLTPTDVARRLRRREWTPVHDGVYVLHTGPLTWQQRAWAAVLACWPAALSGESARRAHEGPGRRAGSTDAPIEIVVAHRRKARAPDGVTVTRARGFEPIIQWNLSPPRVRYDEAIITIADAARDDLAAIAVIADACGGRRTTATRLLAAMERTPRLARRVWLSGIVRDVAEGSCSVLEHAYLTRVEQPHGLPRGLRQVVALDAGGRRMFRDVVYGGARPRWRQIVELDGRLWHDSTAARDRDMERDLDAALDLEDTVRLGYGQVLGRPCRTAAKLGRLLQLRGWAGSATPCPDCQKPDWGTSDQAG